MKIFVDAGHNYSGWNTGAVGNGMREQDITFDVAAELGRILREHGCEVMLSRPTLQTNLGTDNSSSINARWQMSNAWGADYFISIHVNAGGGTGAETLYARADALDFARSVQDVYSEQMRLRNRRVWQRTDLGVLRNTNCPSILLELAFIDSPLTNPDVEILRSKRPEMAAAVAKGVLDYIGRDALPIQPPAADPPSASPEPSPSTIVRYNIITELPSWARSTIEKLVQRGALQGDGVGLDLSADMLRVFVVLDRLGAF